MDDLRKIARREAEGDVLAKLFPEMQNACANTNNQTPIVYAKREAGRDARRKTSHSGAGSPTPIRSWTPRRRRGASGGVCGYEAVDVTRRPRRSPLLVRCLLLPEGVHFLDEITQRIGKFLVTIVRRILEKANLHGCTNHRQHLIGNFP